MTNPIELLIQLGVSDKASKDNINNYIKNLKTEDLGITLTIDGAASNDKVIAKLQKQIESLIAKNKELENHLKNFGGNAKSPKIFMGVGKELDDVKNQIDKFLKDQGFKDFDFKINADTTEGEKTLRTFVATVRDTSNEISKLTFMPDGKGSFTEIKEQMNVTHISEYNKFLKDVEGTLTTISKSGRVSSERIAEFNMKLTELNSSKTLTLDEKLGRINIELSKLNAEVDRIKLDEEMDKARKKVENLESSFIRTVNTYKRETKNMDLSSYVNDFKNLENTAKFTDMYDVRQFNKELDTVTTKVKRFQAETTEAMRGSLTVFDQLKVAMERFPIWMAASTAFYGVVRSAKEFGRIIIDIDTKLTNISKVISDDMDIADVFDRATISAQTFGQSISDALDAYTEFARQGFKGSDLGFLADSGLVAANVGELSAQQASEFMTASMVQWNIEAEKSMSIIDKWNAISNNYATTVEKLAQGQA